MALIEELIRGGRYVCAGIAISNIINLFVGILQVSHVNCKRMMGPPLVVSILLWLVLLALEALLFYLRKKMNKKFHLIVMFITIFLYVCVAIFLLCVTFPGRPIKVIGQEHKIYRLGSFSKYLQGVFTNERFWGSIKECWIRKDYCSIISQMADPRHSKMTQLQFACCMPPAACGSTCKNSTTCKAPQTNFSMQDKDCNAWGNERLSMCFNCDKCKGAYLYKIKLLWQFVGVMNLLSVILPVALFLVCTWTCKREEEVPLEDQDIANDNKILDQAL